MIRLLMTSWASRATAAEDAPAVADLVARAAARSGGRGRDSRRRSSGSRPRPRPSRRRGQSPAGQAAPEPLAAPGQPAPDRPDRAAQVPRGLLAGVAFQVAEDDRRAVALREPVDLLVERPRRGRRGRRRPSRVAADLGPALSIARRRAGVGPAPGPRPGRRPGAARGRASRAPRASRPLRARTRNVAWKASIASWSSRRMPRQARRTIGPCRSDQRLERQLGRLAPVGSRTARAIARRSGRPGSPPRTGSGDPA